MVQVHVAPPAETPWAAESGRIAARTAASERASQRSSELSCIYSIILLYERTASCVVVLAGGLREGARAGPRPGTGVIHPLRLPACSGRPRRDRRLRSPDRGQRDAGVHVDVVLAATRAGMSISMNATCRCCNGLLRRVVT